MLVPFVLASPAAGFQTSGGWTAKLRSSEPSEWRVAQAYLARQGTAALPELATLAEGADDSLKRRLHETISLMLRNAVPPEQIRDYPELWSLGEPELEAARAALEELKGREAYDTGEAGLPMPGDFECTTLQNGYRRCVRAGPEPESSPPRQAIEELLGLRGWAVPAAVELLTDEAPGSRRYGVEILLGLNAIGQYPLVQRLTSDDEPLTVLGGDWVERTTVGEATTMRLRSGALRPASAPDGELAVVLEAENYLDWLDYFARGEDVRSRLLNRLRQEAGTLEAASWDDYWRRAQPVLEAVWDSDDDERPGSAGRAERMRIAGNARADAEPPDEAPRLVGFAP